jgi:hypothetical protein
MITAAIPITPVMTAIVIAISVPAPPPAVATMIMIPTAIMMPAPPPATVAVVVTHLLKQGVLQPD